jgi:transcriptional regulator with XRE-family HTH domain
MSTERSRETDRLEGMLRRMAWGGELDAPPSDSIVDSLARRSEPEMDTGSRRHVMRAAAIDRRLAGVAERQPIAAGDSFGRYVQRVREAAGIDRATLAERLGVALSRMAELEEDPRAVARTPPSVLSMLLDALDLPFWAFANWIRTQDLSTQSAPSGTRFREAASIPLPEGDIVQALLDETAYHLRTQGREDLLAVARI